VKALAATTTGGAPRGKRARTARQVAAMAAAGGNEAYKYVVLGGGNASGYVAKTFVEKGEASGNVCIISDEPYVSYERPALSKAYLFPEKPARLPGFHTCVGGGGERQDPDWYESKGVVFKTGSRVTSADVKQKQLQISNGPTVTYDKLIVATGARPIELSQFGAANADAEGVCYLRNVVDADKLIGEIKKCKSGKAVLIGGGYIGMECAAALSMNGLDITMVFPEDRFMERLFTPSLAEFYEDYYKAKGIKILKNNLVTGFETGGLFKKRVSAVTLKGGDKLECGLAVVGVGAKANSDLFEGQLDIEAGGIKVDGQMKTSDPDVYAIGDVATFPLKMAGGKFVRQEHVTHCRSSAAQAVSSILSPESSTPYDYLPYFYSRVYDLSWQFWGFNEGDAIEFGDKASKKFGAIWVSGGKVVGAFAEGATPEEAAKLKEVCTTRPKAPSESAIQSQGVQAFK